MNNITGAIITGDYVQLDDGYGDRTDGTVTKVLDNGNLFIRYGRNSLAIFNIAARNITLVCQYCGSAEKDVEPTEDPYEADVNNTSGVRVILCPDCYRSRIDDI